MNSIERTRDILTPDQAAEYLQVNRETIYRYIREGKLVASKLEYHPTELRSVVDSLLKKAGPSCTLLDETAKLRPGKVEEVHPEETVRAVKEWWQMQVLRDYELPPAPLQTCPANLRATA